MFLSERKTTEFYFDKFQTAVSAFFQKIPGRFVRHSLSKPFITVLRSVPGEFHIFPLF